MTPTPPPLPPIDADLLDHMARLGERPYSEVGVPMFLMAEDRAQSSDAARGSTGEPDLAEQLLRMATTLDTHRPGYGEDDVARAIEVLADRCILSPKGPVFSRLGADIAGRPAS